MIQIYIRQNIAVRPIRSRTKVNRSYRHILTPQYILIFMSSTPLSGYNLYRNIRPRWLYQQRANNLIWRWG